MKAPSETIYLDDSESQDLPSDSFCAHPDYPIDSQLPGHLKEAVDDGQFKRAAAQVNAMSRIAEQYAGY